VSTLLAAALEYAAKRLPVFPCQPLGKEPAVKGGFRSATLNPETVKRYWRIADRNIGIPTGSISGIWILDIDGDEGERSLRILESKYGALPSTCEVITGGGGRHLWWRYTGPIPSTAGRIGPGIDTRGDSGYCIVPPSVTKGVYTWSGDAGDDLAVAPEWLVAIVRTKPQSISERALASIRRHDCQPDRYGAAALDREIAELAIAPPGTRNASLNRTTFKLFQLVATGELDRNFVIERLIDACHRNGLVADDGWRTVMATIHSGMTAGLKFPRSRSGAT
jgi:Bifunctional DNA primase/polymerase, N-terminal